MRMVKVPIELFREIQLLLLNPKRMVSSTSEITIDWDKRNKIFDALQKINGIGFAEMTNKEK